MSYFSKFPLVDYNGVRQVNLTRRNDVVSSMKENPSYYYDYSIQAGETPEIIADKFYDDAQLAWVILMFNSIVNVFEEWPKGQNELDSYTMEKYENPNGIHHYISTSTGNIVDPDLYPSYDRIPVTNWEYEDQLNDEKRNIKLVLPELVGTIMSRHKELMSR